MDGVTSLLMRMYSENDRIKLLRDENLCASLSAIQRHSKDPFKITFKCERECCNILRHKLLFVKTFDLPLELQSYIFFLVVFINDINAEKTHLNIVEKRKQMNSLRGEQKIFRKLILIDRKVKADMASVYDSITRFNEKNPESPFMGGGPIIGRGDDAEYEMHEPRYINTEIDYETYFSVAKIEADRCGSEIHSGGYFSSFLMTHLKEFTIPYLSFEHLETGLSDYHTWIFLSNYAYLFTRKEMRRSIYDLSFVYYDFCSSSFKARKGDKEEWLSELRHQPFNKFLLSPEMERLGMLTQSKGFLTPTNTGQRQKVMFLRHDTFIFTGDSMGYYGLCRNGCLVESHVKLDTILKDLEYYDLLVNKLSMCLNCFKENKGGKFKACSGCRSVCYCSVKCQSEDWKASHKHKCSKGV